MGSDPLFDQCSIDLIRQKLLSWGSQHFRSLPWRRNIPLWKGLLVEVMLARTRAAQVVPSFEKLDKRFRTAVDLSRATESEFESIMQPLGLRWRVSLLLALAHEIGRRSGRMPRTARELRELPGVGPYVASAALSFHGGVRASIVDSNTVRIVSRLAGKPFDGETRRKKWMREALEALTPQHGFKEFNYAMLDLADAVCKPSVPQCQSCPLQALCVTGSSALRSSGI